MSVSPASIANPIPPAPVSAPAVPSSTVSFTPAAADSVRFSGLFGKKKQPLEVVIAPDGMMERSGPSLQRRFARAINQSYKWAIATLVLTPFKFVPIVNLLAIPVGFGTTIATAWNALGGLLNKQPRKANEKPEFVPNPASSAAKNPEPTLVTEAAVDGNE